MTIVTRSSKRSIEIGNPPILPIARDDSKGFTAAAKNTSARPAVTRSVNASFLMLIEKLSPRVLVRVRKSSRMFANLTLQDLLAVRQSADAIPHLVEALRVLLLQPRQSHQFGVDRGFLDHERVAGSDRFHLGVSQRCGIHVFGAADGGIAGHHLGDEAAFRFQGLPHVGVEAAFGHVAEDFDVFVLVSLPNDAAFALFDVGRSPRGVEMMQCHEASLDVGAFAHLQCAAE